MQCSAPSLSTRGRSPPTGHPASQMLLWRACTVTSWVESTVAQVLPFAILRVVHNHKADGTAALLWFLNTTGVCLVVHADLARAKVDLCHIKRKGPLSTVPFHKGCQCSALSGCPGTQMAKGPSVHLPCGGTDSPHTRAGVSGGPLLDSPGPLLAWEVMVCRDHQSSG